MVAVSSSLLGVYLSFFIDSAPAPTIVVLMTITFVAAFLWSSLSAQVDLVAQTSER
jgi:manganese/iron transport system permease protein